MKLSDILAKVREIELALSKPADEDARECIGCRPIIDGLLLLHELKRQLETTKDHHDD